MTVIYDEDKPSLDELAHHGVKGMKWGQHKKYSKTEIHDARIRQGSRIAQVNETAHKLNLATGKKKDALAKDYVKKLRALETNPDAPIAARMTGGEKAANIILAGPIGLIAIAANSRHVKNLESQTKK
jgi:hypothetical protein